MEHSGPHSFYLFSKRAMHLDPRRVGFVVFIFMSLFMSLLNIANPTIRVIAWSHSHISMARGGRRRGHADARVCCERKSDPVAGDLEVVD